MPVTPESFETSSFEMQVSSLAILQMQIFPSILLQNYVREAFNNLLLGFWGPYCCDVNFRQ